MEGVGMKQWMGREATILKRLEKYMKSWERTDIGDLKVLILHIPMILFSSIFKKILCHSQKNIMIFARECQY